MAGGRILAVRYLRSTAISAVRAFAAEAKRRMSCSKPAGGTQSQPIEFGEMQRARPEAIYVTVSAPARIGDMSNGICPVVAIVRRIGCATDSD
jgi:hypothetical protein